MWAIFNAAHEQLSNLFESEDEAAQEFHRNEFYIYSDYIGEIV